jgi:Lrp/AsnC family transcriptional regulator for asnA, asnC and gidA
MDEIDNQLIRIVERNARQSSGAIAKQLNVSSATVRRRLKHLIDAQELHVVAHVDPVKSGFPVSALTGLNIDSELHDEVVKQLRKLPEVSWASTTTGRFDGFIFARYHSNEHLYDFLKNVLTQIRGIKDSETFICLHIEKSGLLY